MTAISDFTPFKTSSLHSVHAANGARMLMRAVQKIVGVALLLAAAGLWIAPGANVDADPFLMKLLLSVVSALSGLIFLLSGAHPSAPEAEIDISAAEVRLVRIVGRGRKVLQRCAFGELTRAEQRGPHLRLWGPDDNFMAEVALGDIATREDLTAALRQAGKL